MNFKSKLIVFILRCRGIKIERNVQINGFPKIIQGKGSNITISEGVRIGDLVELRATKGANIVIGKNVKLDRMVRIIATNEENVTIGEGTRIGIGTVMNGGRAILIGKNCLVSGYVYLQTSMHKYDEDKPLIEQGYDYGEVTLGDNCWLGVHSVIFPGVTLGSRCIVGSNAVVNKSFIEKSIIGGVPAKLLKA